MSDMLLLIEDERLLGDELAHHYRRQGWQVTHVRTMSEARRAVENETPLVVLSDMSLPDGNALELLEQARSELQDGEWVFLTGYGSVADSVRALRLGAYDFLEKPCDMARLDMVVAGAARSARAQRRLREQAVEQNRRYSLEAFAGSSPAARETRTMLSRLAQVPFSALMISGETGVGKGLAARILHHGGLRHDAPLIEINCAALPHDLLESELFGHEAGAFTGARGRRRGLIEQAHGGTLFLDEVGELSPDLQSKLLKAIEDHRFRRVGGVQEVAVDVQIIAASNHDLKDEVERGVFRGDLFHRLCVFNLELPPLRLRVEDLEDLVPLFIAEFNAKAGKSVRVVPAEVWARLRDYDWPGNVRELRNVVERCVLLSEGAVFPAQWLQLPPGSHPQPARENGEGLWLPLDGSITLDEMDRRIVKAALERASFNITAAARLLGSTRQTLRYRAQKYGLKAED